MIRVGIIGENYQNDACAFKAFLTPQYKGKIEFVPIGPGLNGGDLPERLIIAEVSRAAKKERLNAVLIIRDLDNEAKRLVRNQWFNNIRKATSIVSVFYLAVMELEALILADIETFNGIYGIKGQYTKNPKVEADPKQVLKDRTSHTNKKYKPTHALDIFTKLDFDVVYKKHKDEDSFQAFIDYFEEEFDITPTTKDKLKQAKNKGW
jgi:hypothetical protein